MATEIIMPKAGMDMEEGTIVKWLVQEGDQVDTGDPILEIITDKVNMEVEAEESGTILKITGEEGAVLPVFTVIGYIGEEGEEVPDAPDAPVQPEEGKEEKKKDTKEKAIDETEKIETSGQPKSEEDDESEITRGKVRATPAARKLAREKGIDLADISGSGPKGRVHRADVEEYKGIKATPLAKNIAKVEGIDLEEVAKTIDHAKITKEDVLAFKGDQTGAKDAAPREEQAETAAEEKKLIPMKGMRKIIADRMSESQQTAASVSLEVEVDMTKTMELRANLKERIQKATGSKITFTDIIILATTKALEEYPVVNATLTEKGIEINDHVNMGLAVGLDNGLMVPVINKTDAMSLKEIVTQRDDIVSRTLEGKIKPDELKGSTFSISNLGMFGTVRFNSIINQPNSAILSTGAIVDRVVAVDKQPVVRPIMSVTLTMDHRVFDGADGAKFLKYLKELLEAPEMMLL